MYNSSQIPDILQTGGFSLHYYVGRLFRVGFAGQCCIVAGLTTTALLTASVIDHSLILEGRNVGLLEHPAIWLYPTLQIVLPLCIRDSLQKFQRARLRDKEIVKVEEGLSKVNIIPIRKFLGWKDSWSRLAATLIYCTGLAAWIWNTYQNQQPGKVVPFDFWDSTTYFWGFWITRVYKLYLFGWLLPYIALIQVALLVVTLRFVRRARLAGKLELLPFHPDGVGGLGFVASLISTPIIVMLIIGSLATAFAFLVHRAVDVTPLINLAILVSWALTAYFVPILFLRSDISAMKQKVLRKLRDLQQTNYLRITQSHGLDLDMLSKGKEALDYFDQVCNKIQAISNYPHLKRLVGSVGFAFTTSIISAGLKLLDVAGVIGPLLKRS